MSEAVMDNLVQPVLEARNLCKTFADGASQIRVIDQLNLKVLKGESLAIMGASGSGKSTLAFDTLYAEGQRRYVESLSTYARQFLGGLKKPKVDHIFGLSPAISIQQKSVSKNPRSTVGTITEIYDYLRLLYSRIGQQKCYKCRGEVSKQTVQQIVDKILKNINK